MFRLAPRIWFPLLAIPTLVLGCWSSTSPKRNFVPDAFSHHLARKAGVTRVLHAPDYEWEQATLDGSHERDVEAAPATPSTIGSAMLEIPVYRASAVESSIRLAPGGRMRDALRLIDREYEPVAEAKVVGVYRRYADGASDLIVSHVDALRDLGDLAQDVELLPGDRLLIPSSEGALLVEFYARFGTFAEWADGSIGGGAGYSQPPTE